MRKATRRMALALALSAALLLGGCGTDTAAVYVQRVSALSSSGISAGDRFAGVVVSENVTEIKKDADKTVAELLVKSGDDVKKDQPLFSYDTEELQLSLDKKKLEKEQLEASIENYKSQISELENERANASGNNQLQYTVQIQQAQLDLKEAELNLKAKEAEVSQAEALVQNAQVLSPVDGRIQSISESGTDNSGNPVAYITIQQSGAYRVKGTINELQRGSLQEGEQVRILSRTDESQSWTGTISKIDYENPSQGNDNNSSMGISADQMTSSSKYPFYIELDGTDGLLLGQHVYITLGLGDDTVVPGVSLSAAYVCYNDDGSAYVWADKNGKLEKRAVTLGDYQEMTDTYGVLEGLSEDDYVAFPDETLCKPGAATTKTAPVVTQPDTPEDKPDTPEDKPDPMPAA